MRDPLFPWSRAFLYSFALLGHGRKNFNNEGKNPDRYVMSSEVKYSTDFLDEKHFKNFISRNKM